MKCHSCLQNSDLNPNAVIVTSVVLGSIYLRGKPAKEKRAHLQIGAGLTYTVDIPSALGNGEKTIVRERNCWWIPPSVRTGLCLNISTEGPANSRHQGLGTNTSRPKK